MTIAVDLGRKTTKQTNNISIGINFSLLSLLRNKTQENDCSYDAKCATQGQEAAK